MVNDILCSCGIDNSPIFHTDYFAIYRRQYRDDFCRSKIANGKWIFLLRIWIYTVYSSLFLALGKGTAGFVLGACRQGICFVPIILLLPSFWGINGILYAQPIADVISAIVTVFMALHLHKELATTKEH